MVDKIYQYGYCYSCLNAALRKLQPLINENHPSAEPISSSMLHSNKN